MSCQLLHLLVSGLCFVLYLPVLIVVQGILTAYMQSVWTLTFLRLTRPESKYGDACLHRSECVDSSF